MIPIKSNEYIFKALDEINAEHEKACLNAERKKQSLYVEHPKLMSFDCRIAEVFRDVMKKVVAGEKGDFEKAKEESLRLQKQRADYIAENDVDISATEPDFNCKKCSDTGYVGGRLCECVKSRAAKINYNELNKDVNLEEQTFEKFSLDYYSNHEKNGVIPREIMTKICNFCVKYANEFNENSESLLFFGKTGLGKTHLSLAIANEVIKQGYDVVYGPISRIIGSIEREHFSGSDRATLLNVIDCDLLILDDLGTEFTTPFVVSTIFDIVNSRILNKKPTVINTNLEFEELKQKYSDRIVSRIAGSYRMLQFFGDDIRSIK